MSSTKSAPLVLALAFGLAIAGCGGGTPSPNPPATVAPPPAAPTASISASPSTINQGNSTTLTWQTANANDVSIGGLGAEQANGSQSVTPATSTAYTLTAKGAGGTQTAVASVTVVVPAPPTPPPPPPPPAPPTTLAASYSFTLLPPLPGASNSQALVINNSGVAAGWCVVNGLPEAVKWVNGQPIDLGPGYVLAINDSGELAGIVVGPGGMNEAAYWLKDSEQSITIGLLNGFDSIVANGIDADGTLTGTAFNSFNADDEAGYEWTAAGGIVAVPQLIESFAIRNGTMAGLSPTFEASTAVLTPTVTSSTDLGVSGDALAINSQGDVAGFTFGNVNQAFFWQQGTLNLLGTAGQLASTALSINDQDMVVGYLSEPDPLVRARRAMVRRPVSRLINPSEGGPESAMGWTKTDGIVPLSTLVPSAGAWILNFGDGINNSGQIVGTASMTAADGTVTTTGFVLDPQ
jgi:uncharacterized membrane protein